MANRLGRETSPYLLQHAGNPVDWYPWGEEALERARSEDRPILLSIGYSSCHWCHVMERESFEDPEVARIMNEGFVNVKVDREERPDVDSLYMKAVQAMTGHGGWPLTAFLTPEGVPYYAGTYFPPEPRHGMPSFPQVLEAASRAYRDRREAVDRTAEEVRSLLERSSRIGAGAEGAEEPGPRTVDEALLDRAAAALSSRFDTVHGGIGSAPKFPQPSALLFLLRRHQATGRTELLEPVLHTLRQMARGGIRDHLGGGFHRYSVDARWLVPHFEKMLYDNALLVQAYLDAFRITAEAEMREVAEETIDYVLADLRSPDGGFYSARDADSEGEEGLFYVWTPDEVDEVLGPEDAPLFRRVYDVSAAGNFEGRNILHLPHDLPALARQEGLEVEELGERLAAMRARLLVARARREAPFRDEKILASWNGLMIRSLAEAGAALGRDDYLEAAGRAADTLVSRLWKDGRLLRVLKDGEARIHGFLEDYGAMGNALLTLHEVTLEPGRLEVAVKMADRILELFYDPGEGILYDAPSDGEALVVRPRDAMDMATPSGNSLAVELLLRLGVLLDRSDYRERGEALLAGETEGVRRFPEGFGWLLSAAELVAAPVTEVAIVGPKGGEDTRALLRTLHERYLPRKVVTGRDEEGEGTLRGPLLEGREARGGQATAYVCRGYACREPVTDPGALADQLEEAARARPG